MLFLNIKNFRVLFNNQVIVHLDSSLFGCPKSEQRMVASIFWSAVIKHDEKKIHIVTGTCGFYFWDNNWFEKLKKTFKNVSAWLRKVMRLFFICNFPTVQKRFKCLQIKKEQFNIIREKYYAYLLFILNVDPIICILTVTEFVCFGW